MRSLSLRPTQTPLVSKVELLRYHQGEGEGEGRRGDALALGSPLTSDLRGHKHNTAEPAAPWEEAAPGHSPWLWKLCVG